VRARELSLTLNAPTVAGDLAIVRAAAAIRSGRAAAVLAGGVDEIDPLLGRVLGEMGAGGVGRGEGAGFVVLESATAARERGARPLGEILGAAWRALPARPYCVGRRAASRAIAAALEDAGVRAEAIGRVYTSASGDLARDRWEAALLDAALAPYRPPRESLAARVGRHAGVAALSVAAAALRGATGGPALVHAVARGGNHVAVVVQGS
jgi:3-oxoacyl-(acyl-carrier-protein) synthase